MPFSIKRFAQLHRTHSLPGQQQQQQSKKETSSSKQQKQQQPQHQTSNQESAETKPQSDQQQSLPSSGSKKSSSKKQKSSSSIKSMPAPAIPATVVEKNESNVPIPRIIGSINVVDHRTLVASPQPPAIPTQIRGGNVLGTNFVIYNQMNVPNVPFPLHHAQPQLAAPSSHSPQQPPVPIQGSSDPINIIQAIPTSRSFDAAATEIYRLAQQANVTSQVLRNRSKQVPVQNSPGNRFHSNSSSLDIEDNVTGGPIGGSSSPSLHSSRQKRVHYANQPTTFSKSLGHTSSNSPPPAPPTKPLRPAILPRQTSTTTPTTNSKTSSMLNMGGGGGGSSKIPPNASASSVGPNGQLLLTNLPRGGEEVLINGGGHRSSKSSNHHSSSKPSLRHHHGKHLFGNSSSIDVAVTEHSSNTNNDNNGVLHESTTNNKTSTKSIHSNSMDLADSSRNKTATSSLLTSTANKPSSSNINDSSNINKNDTSQQQNNADSTTRQNKSGRQQQQHQHHQTTTSASSNNRSQSTTPLVDRTYYHHFQANPTSLFDEDPGIMSEIETSATGFRRTNKIRSSLPIVRTPSKSQDRSLGLVFLQFRNETKRALLPNEITSIDTVKALFVRSFPRQLTMEYLDHTSVRIYIHDPNKDMFYELEDLRDVKDRCIIRIYEQGVNGPQPGGGILHQSLMAQTAPGFAQSVSGGGIGGHDGENYGYFSEPEFDSEYQSQHLHRKRFPPMVGQSLMIGQSIAPQSQYYGTIMLPPQFRSATLGPRSGFYINQSLPNQPPPQPPTRNKPFTNFSQTLPRGTHLISPNPVSATINPFGINISPAQPPPQKPQRTGFPSNPVPPQPDIIMIQSLQARPATLPPNSNPETQPIGPYHQNRPLPDRPYSVAGHYPTIDRTGARFSFAPTATANTGDFSGYLSSPEHRPPNALMSIQSGQLRASFSGPYPSTRLYDPSMAGVSSAAPASVPSVLPTVNPAYVARHPTAANVVIDDEARIRMQEMERKIASLTNVVSKALTTGGGPKPTPPPKPPSLIGYRSDQHNSADNLQQLRQIRRKARDLRSEVRQLKRFTVQQINSAKDTMRENCNKIQLALSFLTKPSDAPLRLERLKISANCDAYNEDALRLDKDLLELEAQVEALRSNVINRRCRVNMSNVESMALILSRASKTVADLKARYPLMAQNLKSIMARELHEIEKEEKFLKEEPERLEHSLKRCKKLTGTLVTLKRLASVQEQRSSSNVQTSSPSQLLQSSSSIDKKDSGGSGDENSSSGPALITSSCHGHQGRDSLMPRAKRIQMWRRSVNFHEPIIPHNSSHNYKIEGFSSMPTIQEPITESIDSDHNENDDANDVSEHEINQNRESSYKLEQETKNLKTTKNYDVDLMEPHTIIQVTPATPSSTDSSKAATSNMLDNLLDELQTFSKQSSMERDTSPLSSRSHEPFQRSTGSFRAVKQQPIATSGDTDTIIRKASRSKSYSSIRATSEPPGARSRGSSIPDGRIDIDNLALLASTCGNAAAATAALVEKRFAQSRQELLEQRHQELLHKQRQLQEQYTRLQQLSKRPVGRGFLNDLKKTGSESNIVSKASGPAVAGGITGDIFSSTTKISSHDQVNPTFHGSLHNLASSNVTKMTQLNSNNDNRTKTEKLTGNTTTTTTKLTSGNGNVTLPNEIVASSSTRKTFETDIL